jgi:hypothetical protein
MKKYTVVVAVDMDEGTSFVAWLNAHGHGAKLGTTTGSTIDGVSTEWDITSSETMDTLWSAYCNQ